MCDQSGGPIPRPEAGAQQPGRPAPRPAVPYGGKDVSYTLERAGHDPSIVVSIKSFVQSAILTQFETNLRPFSRPIDSTISHYNQPLLLVQFETISRFNLMEKTAGNDEIADGGDDDDGVDNSNWGNGISGAGQAASTKAARASATILYNAYVDARHLPITHKLDTISPSDFCQVKVIETLSDYLVNDYRTKQNKPLKLTSVLNLLSQVMVSAKEIFKDKFGLCKTTTDFFAVLNTPVNGPSNWYKEIRKNIERTIRRTAIENGEAIKDSAPSVSGLAMREFCFALFQLGFPDAMLRRVICGGTFLAAGRGGEATTTTYDLIVWDHTYMCGVFLWSQIKTGKQKPVVLLNNVIESRWFAMDFYHMLGSLWMSGKGQDRVSSTGNTWMFPELMSVDSNSATKKISGFLEDGRHHPNQSKMYKSMNVLSLPVGATSGSFRTGSINTMKGMGVTQMSIAACGGHDQRGESASYEYQITDVSDVISGMFTYYGWRVSNTGGAM